jgi:signal transduction histidine kinase
MDRRRSSLPDNMVAAFDVLTGRVLAFEELVLDLLEISRFDANAVVLEPEHLVTETFVRQVLAVNCSTAEIVHDASAPEEFVADRRRLAQAFANIIVNADRYAGGLTAVTVTGDAGIVTFYLDDDGPGVDPSERSAIFQRFARGSAGRRAGMSSGTGLGLALAAAQVDLHDGELSVEQAPMGGARFVIRLPQGSAR